MGVIRRYALPVGDGVNLSVDEWGPSEPVATVIATHGWALSGASWERVVDELKVVSSHLRVITYDCRGHGASDPVEGDLATLAGDLAVLIERLTPDGPLVLVGHAMGGAAVLALAERRPDLVAERVDGIVLLSTTAGGLVPAERRDRIPGFELLTRLNRQVLRRGLLKERPLPLVRAAARLLYGKGVDHADIDAAAVDATRTHPPAAAALLTSLLAADLESAVERYVDTCVAVVCGASDRIVRSSQGRAIADHLHGRFVVLPGAGHMLPVERPSQVAMVVAGVVIDVLAARAAMMRAAP